MVGVWREYAHIFLYVAGIAMLVAYGIPLLVTPLAWARLFRWEIPESKALAVFLGRSLGLVITVVAIMAALVTGYPEAMPFFFDMMLWLLVGMLALHIYGAIVKAQPKRETLEIAIWVVLIAATVFFHP